MPPISIIVTDDVQNVSKLEVKAAARQTGVTRRIIVKQRPDSQQRQPSDSLLFQDSLGKPASERLNQSGF